MDLPLDQALQPSEASFRQILRNAPVSVAAQDRDLRYLWAYNQRTATNEQIVGKFDSEIFTAEEAAHLTARKRRVLEEGIRLREQMWFDRPSGRIFLEVCWEPLRDGAGQVVGVGSATLDLTASKLAEEERRENQQRLQLVLQSSAMGTFEVELKTGETRWNDMEFELLGLRRGEVQAEPETWLNHVHPDDMALTRTQWEVALQGGLFSTEHRIVRADGAVRWMAGRGRFIHGAGGSLRFMGVNFDITEHRLAEMAVAEERDRLNALIRSIHDEVWFANPKGEFTLVNPSGLSQFELGNPTRVAVRDLAASLEVLRPDGTVRPLAEAPPLRALAGEVITSQEERVRFTPTGDFRHRQVSAAPVRDGEGAIIGSVSVVRDITELKRAQESLQRINDTLEQKVAERTASLNHANRLLRVISTFNDVLAHATDEAALVKEVCRIAIEIGGYTDACLRYVERAAGQAQGAAARFPPGEPRPGLEGRCILTGELCRGGHGCLVKGPEARQAQAAARGVRASFGLPLVIEEEVVAILEIFAPEVDELQEVEADMLRKVADDLAFGIKAIRFQKEREQVRRELEHRAGQLKTLAAELVQSEQRERDRLAKVLHDHLQQILVAAKWRVAALPGLSPSAPLDAACRQVTEMLDEAILASRDLTTELSPMAIQQQGLVPALEWLANKMRERHGLQVAISTDAPAYPLPPETKAFLFEAARELLFNVIKHAGTRQARIRIARLDAGVEVVVEDDGAGFALDERQEKGHGLSRIQERLRCLGGRILINSAPGQGSQFQLLIPLEEPSVPSQPSRPEAAPPRIRLLLVDDHVLVRQGLARVLEGRPDLEVVGEAADGREAVELARRTHPDAILMDLNMPVMSGIEATRIIHGEQPEIRIIALSMHTGTTQANEMKKAGAVAFICKSDPLAAIVATILASFTPGSSPEAGSTEKIASPLS